MMSLFLSSDAWFKPTNLLIKAQRRNDSFVYYPWFIYSVNILPIRSACHVLVLNSAKSVDSYVIRLFHLAYFVLAMILPWYARAQLIHGRNMRNLQSRCLQRFWKNIAALTGNGRRAFNARINPIIKSIVTPWRNEIWNWRNFSSVPLFYTAWTSSVVSLRLLFIKMCKLDHVETLVSFIFIFCR